MGLASWPYLISSDERLHGQMVLHQLLHVGLSSNQRLGLRQLGQAHAQRRRTLVGGARGSPGISVPEENVPRLERRQKEKKRTKESGPQSQFPCSSFVILYFTNRSSFRLELEIPTGTHGSYFISLIKSLEISYVARKNPPNKKKSIHSDRTGCKRRHGNGIWRFP